MLVNEYKPEFYDRKVRKMRNLSNVYICGSPFVMSRTSIFNLFGAAVRIIQDGKNSSPIRSDAYFPEWKPAFSLLWS